MIDSFIALFGESFWGHILATFFVSMIPVIELRAALPIGIGLGLHPLVSYCICIVGNMLPVPFIILFIRRIFHWLRAKSPFWANLVSKLEKKAEKQSDIVAKYALLGLYIFVAIPLPGTGAWTGALIAALMDMRLRRAFPVIALGVMTAGLVMLLISVSIAALL